MPYLISYLIAGLIFAVSLLVNGRVARSKRVTGSVLVILVWPLLVLVAPEEFLGSHPEKWEPDKPDLLQQKLSAALSESTGRLGGTFNQSLARTAKRGEPGVAYFADGSDFAEILDEFWDSRIPPAVLSEVQHARWALVERDDAETASLAMLSRKPPDWLVGFSTEFLKSISNTDARLRGRILDAVSKISIAPMQSMGDTVKPLSATLSGMWRYRIGDHRLVYLPDAQSKKITLLYFGPRGDVYSKL